MLVAASQLQQLKCRHISGSFASSQRFIFRGEATQQVTWKWVKMIMLMINQREIQEKCFSSPH